MFHILDDKKNKGFTLLELIITIFLLTVGIVGSYTVISHVISTTAVSSSRLTAAYLAQEGIEIVRNIRDTNWLEGASSWDEGLTGDPCYEADYDDPDLTSSERGYDNLRFLQIDGGFYNYGSGDDTKFKRAIIISGGGTNSLEITVRVMWKERGELTHITAEEHLYNWLPR